MKTDLHIHTYYSDGVFSPEKIVDTALDVGLQAIAITDHDNVLAYDVAQKYIKEKELGDKLEVIRGIEVNTLYKNNEVHILGYFMNPENSDFQSMLKSQQQARIKQTKEILALLSKKEGIKIKFEDVKKLVAEGGSIGRPHIAKAITNAGGTTNVMDAYAKYIHEDSPVYVQRKTVTQNNGNKAAYPIRLATSQTFTTFTAWEKGMIFPRGICISQTFAPPLQRHYGKVAFCNPHRKAIYAG